MNQKDLEQQSQQIFIAHDTPVTYLGTGGVVSGIIRVLSYLLEALWFEYDRLRRKIFLATATTTDLDNLGTEKGVVRETANASGVVLAFNGTTGTSIPAGTIVRAYNGLAFETTADLTLGSAFSGYTIVPSSTDTPLGLSYSLRNKVYARCQTTGITGNVPANTITITTISGVTVTNPYPAENGRDTESDTHFRSRLAKYYSILDLNTIEYYEMRAKQHPTLGTNILRVLPVKSGFRSIDVYIVTKDGAGLSSSNLTILTNYLKTYLPVLSNITCRNIVFTPITISVRIEKEAGYTTTQIYQQMASNLSTFIDWSTWDFGNTVDDADLLLQIKSTTGVKNVFLDSFTTHLDSFGYARGGDIYVPTTSLPRLVGLSIAIVTSSTDDTATASITDSYSYEV